MSTWKQALREGAISGAVASLLSAAVLVLAGTRHTLAGYLIHHAASVWWATLHAKAWGTRARARRPAPALAGAAAAAAVACFVDLVVTPRRFTPGFEHRLSPDALLGVYSCFALGLALGSMAVPPVRR